MGVICWVTLYTMALKTEAPGGTVLYLFFKTMRRFAVQRHFVNKYLLYMYVYNKCVKLKLFGTVFIKASIFQHFKHNF